MNPVAQQYICDLTPYQPGLPIDAVARSHGLDPAHIIKLASNENPLGMSPKAKAALQKALPGANRYPEQHALVQALAKQYKVNPSQIVLGNGSNDVLDLLARSYLGQGTNAVSSQYAFAMYAIATQSAGATNIIVPAKAYGHDLTAMAQAITPSTNIVWIANPNNPTGTFIPYPEVKNFLGNIPQHVVVVLDEAYYEYLDAADQTDIISWIQDHPNLVIVRTFSKIYGLAGLRIGYAVASKPVAELLNRVRQPFNANVLALAAATAALTDKPFVQRSHHLNQQGRAALLKTLEELHITYLPAYGNFVTFRHPKAANLHAALSARGIILRPLTAYGMSDWLRATIGTPKEMTRLTQVLIEDVAGTAAR